MSSLTKKTKEFYLKLNSNKNFEFWKEIFDLSNLIELIQKFEGLNIKKSYRRSYPHGPVVSQILGYNDTDGHGISGLEKDYNSELSGEPGIAIKSKGWKGNFKVEAGFLSLLQSTVQILVLH